MLVRMRLDCGLCLRSKALCPLGRIRPRDICSFAELIAVRFAYRAGFVRPAVPDVRVEVVHVVALFCQIQRISSIADLNAVRRNVMMGNSFERSYLLTMQNFFIVCAGVPSSHLGRTSRFSSLMPLSRMLRQVSIKFVCQAHNASFCYCKGLIFYEAFDIFVV